MTIPLKELAAQWFADPEFKREYDALAPEFEALAKKLRARKRAAAKAPASRHILQPDRNPPPQR
jgi:type IV secretory pathway TraG/TraD family ATPase VirD4